MLLERYVFGESDTYMCSVQGSELKMFKDQISKTTMAAAFKLLAVMAAVKGTEGGRFNQSYVIFNI